ncbi:LysE family transporter [Stutzerimonas sp. R40042]|uniref:LysE family transporter n=1 Tax=Stutzerimonas frequens TaxID=2968969 RepID=A0AA47E452_9GAMM|nr:MULTISPECIES: LysE family transporter [Stutzerimonas]MCD1639019.1 LysE family transporter [Stutzerimonas stutzeri]MDL0441098.1 LysE family transporter [Stutzerimonas frequens]RRV68654.1 LysE family translocator [Stutzerimonas stutzeri]WAE53648.1 LysE family transporter [Stutzerimonas frequens]WAE63009.1 LysE family transporter [Stutzerimonas sp. R40042]
MYWMEFMTVALVHLLAVASPGPDFAVVVRESVAQGRRAGSWTALGVGCGIFVHVAYSLLGIGLIVSQSIVLFNLFKWLAAAYLVYLGWRALRARPMSLEAIDGANAAVARSAWRAFVIGFVTNGLNPKATLFFLSLFTVVISPDTPLLVQAGYGVYLAGATALWFLLVAWLFSRGRVRAGFARMGHWFDRLTGAVLIGLGARLALSEIG